MGQGRQPNSLAWGHNDRSRSGADRCTGDRLSREPDLSLQVACAPRNPVPFCNNSISSTVGKDQNLGNNRRYCEFLEDLGRHLKRSIGTSKRCELPLQRVVAGIAYVVNDSKKKSIYIRGGEYQHVDRSVCVSLFGKRRANQIDPILDIITC